MAIVQIRHDTACRAYFCRRVAAGKTPMETLRVLKRRLSDVVYRQLVGDAGEASPRGHTGATRHLPVRTVTGVQAANFTATMVVGLVNAVANQQLTFGATSRGSICRHLMPRLAFLGVTLRLTAGALAVMTAADPEASRLTELSVVVASSCVGGLIGFCVLRLHRTDRLAVPVTV